MTAKNKILLSACLAGHRVRYNGTDKSCTANLLQQWHDEDRLVIHCPELAAGLETPRLSAEMINGQGIDVLNGRARVVESDGRNVTQPYVLAAWLALQTAQRFGLIIRPLPYELPRIQINLFWHSHVHQDAANTWLRRCFMRLFTE